MKKYLLLFFCSIIYVALMQPYCDAQEPRREMTTTVEPFVIFGPDRSVAIPYSLCNRDTAKHGVKVGKDAEGKYFIHWRWDNKRSSWCGWGIQDIPYKDFSSYEHDFKLEIKIKGYWTDRAPQIKFMDRNNKSTKLVRIRRFMQGDPQSNEGSVVTIPLREFDMDWSIDVNNVHTLQFDAAYESSTGDIKIYHIKLVR